MDSHASHLTADITLQRVQDGQILPLFGFLDKELLQISHVERSDLFWNVQDEHKIPTFGVSVASTTFVKSYSHIVQDLALGTLRNFRRNILLMISKLIIFIGSIACALALRLVPRIITTSSLKQSKHASLHMVLEKSNFLNFKIAREIKDSYQTPVYVYDENTLRSQASKALAFPNPYGLTVRFAMKASPNAAILQIFHSMGLHIDASSGYEVIRAIRAGIPSSHISLSSQEMPPNFKELYEMGIEFNACSLHQLETFGLLFPGGKCGIRFNPGKGSGGTGKTNVGGPSSSFGIWHEQKDEVKNIVSKFNLNVVRIHTHIGSGSDPVIWQNVAGMSIDLVRDFPAVTVLNLGGGYKVGRMSYEKSTDLLTVGEPVKQ
eukprot:gene5937-11978_t